MKKTLLALALGLTSTLASAQNIELLQTLQKKYPNTQITSAEYIKEIPGMVEMIVGKNKIIYTNATGSHFVIGHVFEAATNTDVTQARIESLSSYDYKDLPFQDSIKVVKGNGKREFAVFTDPACPYCKRLEQELARIDNYTMYVFPLAFKPQGKVLTSKVLCQSDQGKAWTNLMQHGIAPQTKDSCGNDQIQRVLRLASEMGVSGTPALLSKKGKIRPGYMPAAQLESWLNVNAL